jgi:hypothetical protein
MRGAKIGKLGWSVTRAAAAAAAGCALLTTSAACIDPTSFLNPQFLAELGLREQSSFIPGEAPAILVVIDNKTDRQVEAQLSYRVGGATVRTEFRTLPPGTFTADAPLCPITELTLGDISNLEQPGAIIRLGGGSADDAYLSVEPFGALLKEGINFDCGDAIRFTIQASSATASGYQIFAFIQRSN